QKRNLGMFRRLSTVVRQLNPKTANSETFPPYGGKVSEFRIYYFLKVCLTFWGQVNFFAVLLFPI
ncbi:MAG: hypothetical protein LBM59_02530, partial [Ruminococcus sp.]|nr:hypothetical protein [Ruminococcus sp.]